MNRILGRVASILGVALVAGMAAPACSTSDESESIFIRGMLAPPTTRTNGHCTYTNDPSQPFRLGGGVFDLGLSSAYTPVLLVGNQLLSRGDQNSARAESNRVNIEAFEVEITDTSDKRIGAFRSPATGIVDPQGSNEPSYAVVAGILIDSTVSAAIAKDLPKAPLTWEDRQVTKNVLVYVRAVGSTLAGTEVKSGAYKLPVTVCNGCLVSFATAYDPATQTINCQKPFTEGTDVVRPCELGQDELVPCELCSGAPACVYCSDKSSCTL